MINKKLKIFLTTLMVTSIFSFVFSGMEAKAYNAGGDGKIKFNSWDINNYGSTADLWTQTRENYAPEKIKDRVTYGDYDGNGKDEVIAFYDFGNATTEIHRLSESNGKYTYTSAWKSGANNFNANSINSKVVSGDFNGDGKDEVLALYDYFDRTATIFQFSLNSDGQTFSNKSVFKSTNFIASTVRAMVAGDFDGDGKDEVLVFVDYGNRYTGMFELKMNSNGTLTDRYAWESLTYDSNRIKDKTVAGDFNGDGKDEVAMFYDYGDGTTRIWSLSKNSNSYSAVETFYSASFDASNISGKVVATHNDNGSKDKIIALYDYTYLNNVTGVFSWEMQSDNKFTAKKEKELTGYEAARVTGRVAVGKINGVTTRLLAMYDGTIVQAQTQADKVIAEAKKHLGKPYVWGGTGPNSFDCSGFTQYVYKQAVGITLPRVISTEMSSQRGVGTKVSSISDLKIGDLVITNNYNHIGIYVGNGQYINAQGDDLGNTPGLAYKVVISNIYNFNEGRRVL